MYTPRGATTIYSVAREAGVSMATVSRVVNGNPNVKTTTRQRVLEAISQLNYRPNAVARGLASKRTTMVGVVLPDIGKRYYAELARGIEDVATMQHYMLLLCSADLCQERELTSIGTLLERRVDGLLFLGETITPTHRALFASMGVPVVLVAMQDSMAQIPHVAVDELRACKEATEVLLAEGHRSIAFLGMAQRTSVRPCLQQQGYHLALHQHGMPVQQSIVRLAQGDYASGYRAMLSLLRNNPEVTSVLVAGDALVTGALHAALDAGKRIPEDLSLIGLADPLLTDQLRPLVSTVGAPIYDVGAAAMYLLTQYMQEENTERRYVTLPYRITLRNSTRLQMWQPGRR